MAKIVLFFVHRNKKGGSFFFFRPRSSSQAASPSCPSEGDNWMYANRPPEVDGWSVPLVEQLRFVLQPFFAEFLQLAAFFVDGLLELLLLLVQVGQFLQQGDFYLVLF